MCRNGSRPYSAIRAITSTSISAPLGSDFTTTAERAGYGSVYAENGVGQIINASGQPVLTLEKGETVEAGNHNGLIGIHKYDNGQSTFKYINLEGKTVYMWVESY